MDRREFFKKSIGAGIAAGTAITFGGFSNIIAKSKTNISTGSAFDLVAVRGGEPAAMFDRAVNSLGGMKNFVKSNQTVVVKPNIGWDTTPERGANTNPDLVYRIVEQCINAGAKDVYVFDHTCDTWQRAYKNSGIEKAVNDAGGTIVSGDSEGYYQDVEIKVGKSLKSAKVHQLILDSDVFINVPVLKHHSSASLTVTMKNLMGVVWDRRYWHRNNLHQCIADYAAFNKPTLNVVDAYAVMKRNGPRGISTADVVSMKSLLVSTDMVASDAAAAKLFGMEPEQIPYIKIAHDMNVGSMDLKTLNIDRIKI
ncbi:DUF362 domain-containing protein [Bacteroidota bacterium]